MRMAEGVESILQLSGLVARLCRVATAAAPPAQAQSAQAQSAQASAPTGDDDEDEATTTPKRAGSHTAASSVGATSAVGDAGEAGAGADTQDDDVLMIDG